MSRTGSITDNFHEGSRSEYFAQYFFSSFGTSVQVPHQEDSGIDLYCTLGERKGNLLYVDNYFFVQIKSTNDTIIYENESCNWLTSHKYPLLIVIINKNENTILIYATLMISKVAHMGKVSKISLMFTDNGKISYIEKAQGEIVLYLGKPIIQAFFNDVSSRARRLKYKEILKYWIQQDQENIDRKTVGFDLVISPSTYETNTTPSGTIRIDGNFLSQKTSQYNTSYNSMIMLYLSNEINMAAKESDREKYEQLYCLAETLLKRIEVYNYAFEYFKTAIFAGKKRTKSNINIDLVDSNGEIISDPHVNIVT